MFATIAPAVVVVKPADDFLAARPELIAAALAPADLDDSWIMADDEADALAAESADFDRCMLGAYAW